MNEREYRELHAGGVGAMRTYFVEAEKTSVMLGDCKVGPQPFDERLRLITQEIAEKEAYTAYFAFKRLLHEAVRSGYVSPE